MNSDILVVGAGVSGLMAAITAAKSGAKVSVVSDGAGVLAIGGGAIDFLGYVDGKEIEGNPYDYIDKLDVTHPYQIVGKDTIKSAFNEVISISKECGYEICTSDSGHNIQGVTILGTTKPTYISSKSFDASVLLGAKKVLILGMEYLKDSQPDIMAKNLSNNPRYKGIDFSVEVVKSPFGKTHRVLNVLDIARYVDSQEGQDWLCNTLQNVGKGYDVIIAPTIFGVETYSAVYKRICDMGIKAIETIAVPPGVGGLRLRDALYQKAVSLGVRFISNCKIVRATVEGKLCKALIGTHGNIGGAQESTFEAKKFIIATGGIIGGGIFSNFDRVEESIFKIKIDAPSVIEDWSDKDFFGTHKFATFGLLVSKDMKAVDGSNQAIYDNVFFAGNTLGHYDFPTEKSGYGVAISSGYAAGKSAIKE